MPGPPPEEARRRGRRRRPPSSRAARPTNVSTLARATSAKSERRSNETSRPSRRSRGGARATARPSRRPPRRRRLRGRCRPRARICAASFGYTIAAPRGIDMTKSRRSGRSARYSWPPLLVTTEPSGWPMSSVCLRTPWWVCSSPSPRSVMVCRRPLGPVSWTRSPMRKGPLGRGDVIGSTPVAGRVIGGIPRRPARCDLREWAR